MTYRLLALAAGFILASFANVSGAAEAIEMGFARPPASARPWVYWFPLDGNLSREGITLDLEAMARVGIGGVLYMETEQGTPTGPAAFAGPLWRELFKHICAEAARLGLEVNMNNDAGWCGSGGPWITPELSMQRVVWLETEVTGPAPFDGPVPQPAATAGYYRDIAVFAYPTPTVNYVIPHIRGKSAAIKQEIPLRASFQPLPAGAVIPRDRLIDLTAQFKDGRLAWQVPQGKWTILRMGHTSTGATNLPAPASGRGLECDKLSKEAAEAHFNGLMAKLIDDNRPLVGQGKTLVSMHIDSWEVGSQNWTPRFREEFRRLRGYDPLPWLPVMRGRVIDNLEVSERFLWDLRQTINDLLVENYAGHFRELARRNGIRLSIEAYDGSPTDDMMYAGQADEPMAEFWSWGRFGAAYSCTQMSSAAHVYGKPILGAEAFTATDAEKWQGHPGNIKDLGDWAFCEGINRFVFHRYALQPWKDQRPGMSMGPWGLHYERTQTWWEQSGAWHQYLSRCQHMLQQGLFVADLCFLAPETSPQRFKSPVKSGFDRPGYNFDGCPPHALLTRMSVQDGRITLPDGMSYRMLVLPRTATMTPALLRKIKELVMAGATVVGAPPIKSPSLEDYPRCDEQVRALAAELWGGGEAPAELTERRVGKGRIFWGGEFRTPDQSPEAANLLARARWIWHDEGNPAQAAPPERRFFRRAFRLDRVDAIASARLTMTADNSFVCMVNGRKVGEGDNFTRTYDMNVKSALRDGENVITVTAVNGADHPNPAGLIGILRVQYAQGPTVDVTTDGTWQSAVSQDGAYSAARELGALGMEPWGDIEQLTAATDPIPDINILCDLLGRQGVAPDFASEGGAFRYIHKRIGRNDVYFVANKDGQPRQSLCSFRVTGKRPELWWPENGRIQRPAVYDQAEGMMRMPLWLEAHESVFVVFRDDAGPEADRIVEVSSDGRPAGGDAIRLARGADGRVEAEVRRPGSYFLKDAAGNSRTLTVESIPLPIEVGGPWEVRFAPGWGAPEQVILEKLISWHQHPDAGVKYFSGTAVYRKSFDLPADRLGEGRKLHLDLGRVAVMAQVTLNGTNLGTLWKEPYRVDITGSARAGANDLEIRVVNLWINRQIGDEQLPEDSDRNPNGTLKSWPKWVEAGQRSPTGRYTFTSWRLWKKDDALAESGLIGPVKVGSSVVRTASR